MANSKIKGITIEIDGSTKGLDKALQDVNKQSRDLQSELREVEMALKFNPGNIELVAQKQQLLSQQVETTTKKLEQLKSAQTQVEKQFQSGDIGADQYRAFQREIIQTESKLDKFKKELASIDDVKATTNLKSDFQDIQKEAESAGEEVKDLGGELTNLLAGAASGKGISDVIEDALDIASLNTKIEISMDVPPESIESVKQAINTVSSYGVDAEEALEGVRRQWALNKDASNESNTAVVQGAATIAKAYSGIDFNELIQETNEISSALNISNEEALGLTNALLKMGFPPEQLDIIAEYGTQLSAAGYNAQEIQAIMAAGVETGTWNIDNLLDGLKEGRIKLAEFGQEVPKATQELLKGTSVSTEQLQKWGQAVSRGGEEGKKAMQDVAQALLSVKDETTRNALGVQFFGTMWEDQGTNITDTLLNMGNHLTTAKQNQDDLNQSTQQLSADPAVQMEQAMAKLKLALSPLLETIAGVIGKIAEWVSDNPTLAATIAAVVTAIGILIGIIMGLAPIITAITAAAGAFGVSIGAIAAPVLIVIGVITALIAIGVALYKNWDEVKVFLANCWESIKEVASNLWSGLKDFFSNTWDSIKETFNTTVEAISSFLSEMWDSIKNTISTIWEGIKSFFSSIWESIRSIFQSVIDVIINFVVDKFDWLLNGIKEIFDGLKMYCEGIWQVIKNIFLGAILLILDLVTGNFTKLQEDVIQIWNNIKEGLNNIWEGIKQVFSGALDIIKGYITNAWNGIKNLTTTIWEKLKLFLSNLWESIKTLASNAWEGLKNTIVTFTNAIKITIVNVWNSILDFFKALPETLRNLAVTMFTAMKNGIVSTLINIKQAAQDISQGIVNTFKELPEKLIDIGKNVVQGLIDGIKSKITAVKDAITSVTSAITDKVRNILDIHSPSRVMMKMGEYTGDGFALGIKSTIGEISRQSQAMARAVNPSVTSGNISVSSNRAATNSGISGIKQTVNIYSPTALSPAETARQNRRVLQELALQS